MTKADILLETLNDWTEISKQLESDPDLRKSKKHLGLLAAFLQLCSAYSGKPIEEELRIMKGMAKATETQKIVKIIEEDRVILATILTLIAEIEMKEKGIQ